MAITRLGAFGFGTRRAGSFDRGVLVEEPLPFIAGTAKRESVLTACELSDAPLTSATKLEGTVTRGFLREFPR